MAERFRLPGLVDLLIVSSPAEVRTAAQAPALDRDFAAGAANPAGMPLVNRVLLRRLARGLRTDAGPLPSAAARDDAARQAAQRALAERLDPARTPFDAASVDALAEFVRGRSGRSGGELAQEAIGRLFAPNYRADDASWRAAERLDASLRSNNVLRRLWWRLTGAVPKAQAELARRVADDSAGVHATGVAVHSLLDSLERLRAVLDDRDELSRLSTRGVLGRAMTAPETVVRRVTEPVDLLGTRLTPGTLVLLGTRGATEASADPRVQFLSDTWSACPAEAFVPALLARVWAQATAAEPTARQLHRPPESTPAAPEDAS